MGRPGTQPRSEPVSFNSELERLCGYLKNDSVIKWYLGCSAEDIARARANIAKRRRGSFCSKVRHCDAVAADNGFEDRKRRKAAEASNRAYLLAVATAELRR